MSIEELQQKLEESTTKIILNDLFDILNKSNSNDDIYKNLENHIHNKLKSIQAIIGLKDKMISKLKNTFNMFINKKNSIIEKIIQMSGVEFKKIVSKTKLKNLIDKDQIKDNIFFEFFIFDIEDNFERIYYSNIINSSLSIYLNRILSDSPSTFLNGILILLTKQLKDINRLVAKKYELNFLKSKLLPYIKNKFLKLDHRYTNMSLNTELVKTMFFNVFTLWTYYNGIFVYILDILASYISINLEPLINNSNYKFAEYFLLNTYLSIIFFMFLSLMYKLVNTTKEEYTNLKLLTLSKISEINQNKNVISETNKFNEEVDNLFNKFNNLLDLMFEENINLPFIFSDESDKIEELDVYLKYILFLLIPFRQKISTLIVHLNEDKLTLLRIILRLKEDIITYNETNKILKLITDDIDNEKYIPNINSYPDRIFTVENISVCYDNIPILDNINVIIPKNKWICLYGNSGCGKTSFINVLLKKVTPSNGNIQYHYDIDNNMKFDIYKNVSHLSSVPELFNDSVLYNLKYGLHNCYEDSIDEQINYYTKLFNLDDINLDTNVNLLSTGQKQRVSIIRCIIHDKPIIIIDESTSHIDNETERIILTELSRIQREKHKTIIHITHNIENKQFADMCLYIFNKKLIQI
jgi:ABC-type multidrug transport system fused ATPase/permease subunit